MDSLKMMKVMIVPKKQFRRPRQGGVAGLGAAYLLSRRGHCRVTLYEKEDALGGHALTIESPAGPVDVGFQARDIEVTEGGVRII